MLFLKSIVVWFILIAAESMNGTLREFWLIPSLGESRAHQISFVTAACLVLAIALLFICWLHTSRISQLFQIGLLWLCLTLGFEIGLGRLVMGYSWARMGADYNLLQGGLMPIGSLWLALSPLIAAKLRGVFPSKKEGKQHVYHSN
jgi:hypothetical protein